MYNNGKTYIWIPSALTLSTLTPEAAVLINTVHAGINQATGASKKIDYVAGNLHEYYFAMNDLDMGGAPFTRDATPGLSVCGPIENLMYLPLDYVSLIVMFGGDIEGLPVWFEFDDPDSDCPFSTETPKESWNEWGVFGDSHKPVELGSKWYRSSAVGQSGQLLDASVWVPLRAAGGLVVKTKAEYLAIQAANQPSLP